MADLPTPIEINQAANTSPQVQTNFQNQAPAVPQAQQTNAFLVYAPQMYQQNQIQYAKNQVQPIQYPQLQQPQQYLQQPLLPNQQQQIIPPQITTLKETLKHDELSVAGYQERRHFNLTVLKYYLVFQALAFTLCICSYKNGFIKLSFDLNGHFKVPFYVFVIVMSLSLLYSYTNHKKLRDSQLSTILVVFYGISYALFIQALYSSTYYFSSNNNYYYGSTYKNSGFDAFVIVVISFVNLETYSIFAYCMQEVEELSAKNSFWYVVIPTVTYGGILFSLYYNYELLCIVIVLSCGFGFYLQFTLKRMINSKKFKLRSDEGRFAAVLFSFLLLVPFFDLVLKDNQKPAENTQSENPEQKNVQ